MAIPAPFQSLHRRRTTKSSAGSFDANSTIWEDDSYWYKLDLRRNTRARSIFAGLASLLYLLSWIFLMLVELGQTKKGKVLGEIYFFRLSLADIIPTSIENAQLINSIARGIGLHDFYQPGLWNFCEGFNDEGITSCSSPKSYFWFNPVDIILNELLSGATIALPAEITQILGILKICSNIMFAFFLAGTIISFLMVFLSPMAIFSRWWALPMSIVSFLTFLIILVGSVIASVISFVFKYAATAQTSLNINARDLKSGRKPMRHSSMKRAQSKRSQMSQVTHSRDTSAASQQPQGRSRSNTAFSFDQQPAGHSRSGTVLSTHDENGVSRSNSLNASNAGDVSRSNTLRGNNGQVNRSNTVGSITKSQQPGRSRTNTLRSIRFQDERPPSYESDKTAVNEKQGGTTTPHQRGTSS
ncbi:hypothetical protein INS49_012609 [Diaporthe citri]|uniref:uncharacterized protein n=1 Tax=Diaporthe citri TaxID=83186 RepID=UPI001C81327A|nr:uncharacterized protein INS49_012609 [Diaporthe citri]KAG6359089.1 hypothetical protein INS49_012609 [Diaporthe citri]